MLIHINRADSWDKENRAPKFFSNCQPRKNIDINFEGFSNPSHTTLDSRGVVKTTDCQIPGAPKKKQLMEHDLLCAPKSIDFANEGKSFEDEFSSEDPAMLSKHAWTAQLPSTDTKSHNGSSLPVLNGSNITVDSPDPTSKFYSKSPPSNCSGEPDSTDSEALYLAMCNIANMCSPEPGSMKRRRSITTVTPENASYSKDNSSSCAAETESLPSVSSSNPTMNSPDPHGKYNPATSRGRPTGYNNAHGVSQGRVAPRLLRLQIENDEKSPLGSTIRQARRPSLTSEKEDIFTKSVSPFKSDYEAVIGKLRSTSNAKETVLKSFSPTAAKNPENHLPTDKFHDYDDFMEDESSAVRKEEFISFSSTIRNPYFVQSINGNSRRNLGGNIENLSKSQTLKSFQSPQSVDLEGGRQQLEGMSFIRDLRRRKSEMNISIDHAVSSSVRRSSDDTFDSPKTRDKESKILREKRNSAIENFSDKEHSNLPRRVIRPSPPLLPLKSRNDPKIRYDRLQPVGPPPDSNPYPGSSSSSRGQGVSAPTQFVKNGRTYRSIDLTEGTAPHIVTPIADRSISNQNNNQNNVNQNNVNQNNNNQNNNNQNNNHNDDFFTIRDITDYREVKEKEKERERRDVRTSSKVSNGPTRSREQTVQFPPPTKSISPPHNKRSVPKYFDDESNTPSGSRSPENETQSTLPRDDKAPTDLKNETHRPAKIRISTAAVTQMYVRTKNAKKKKRSLSYYLIRGVSLEPVPEDEELVNFVEYQQIKTRRGASVSDLMKQLKKIF